ncbi:acetyltransferase (GNAT) family protein [Kribbella sp. VKM Ac-2527]|uniref:Acetyltransferase (GNAT) family protein n=1 Tax=Kribbella caucasensis TaxID=2512215 RepID=A0A4R6KAL8_9ACTN|nr:GNAT family N-acetyltransferase [Kribbella sp. VKM Ac-2527]TDO45711.1 acetyltransferase (GNAT) family protein [Kribbella sp. VKM Ac-2527]
MTAQSIGIRRAGPADAALLVTMIRELADYQDEGQYVTIPEDKWRELLTNEDVIVLIAESGEQAAGYVSAYRRPHFWTGGDILALDDLYVREQFRDGGVGRTLMLELARLALPQQLTITWGMRPENVAGQRFYARLGAKLKPKVVAAWDPATYSNSLAD